MADEEPDHLPRDLPAEFADDPAALELISEALRAGPGTPVWRDALHQARGRAREASGPPVTELALLRKVRERLEQGRKWRSVKAGPEFTAEVMSQIDLHETGRRASRVGWRWLIIGVSAGALTGLAAWAALTGAGGTWSAFFGAGQRGTAADRTAASGSGERSDTARVFSAIPDVQWVPGQDIVPSAIPGTDAPNGLRSVRVTGQLAVRDRTAAVPAGAYRQAATSAGQAAAAASLVLDRTYPSGGAIAVDAEMLPPAAPGQMLEVLIGTEGGKSVQSIGFRYSGPQPSEPTMTVTDGAGGVFALGTLGPASGTPGADKSIRVRMVFGRVDSLVLVNGRIVWRGAHRMSLASTDRLTAGARWRADPAVAAGASASPATLPASRKSDAATASGGVLTRLAVYLPAEP